ncbi:MAG: glycosyltransferase [Planctomycetota bacterium]
MAPPIRILRVIARMNVGGPARQMIELSRGMQKYGFETILATGEPAEWEGDLRPEAQAHGIEVITIPGLSSRVKLVSDGRAFVSLVSLMKRLRPQLLHTHTAKAGALGRLAARAAGVKPRVHTFHGTVFDHYFSAAASKWIIHIEKRLAKTTDRIVAVSHAVADELDRIGLPQEKIRVIEPVIDLEPFLSIQSRNIPFRTECGAGDGDILIGWIGRFVKIKDPLAFIEAASIAAADRNHLRFVMIGGGPLQDEMQQKAQRLKIDGRIVFLPFQPRMAEAYAGLDLLVSTSQKEGMPVAVLEAMAAAVPVVATAVGGTVELIADERSGFLVAPGEPRAAARAIERFLEMPAGESKTLRGVARVRARERFGLARGLERHAQMYQEILQKDR